MPRPVRQSPRTPAHDKQRFGTQKLYQKVVPPMADLVDILIAEDDPDDRLFIRRALRENKVENEVREVENGAELLDYLRGQGAYASMGAGRRPGLILLDLNMPRKSGREVLRELKSDPDLRTIPVVVLTTSDAESDVTYSYRQGANAFITKPASLADLLELFKRIDAFWLKAVQLPASREKRMRGSSRTRF